MADSVSTTGNLDVNYDGLGVAKEEFKKANEKFKVGPKTTMGGNTFSALTTPEDFISSWLSEVNKSIDEILQFAEKHLNGLNAIEPTTTPTPTPPAPPTPPGPGGYYGGGGGGGGGGTPPATTPPTSGEEVKPIDTSSLSNLNLKELDNVVDQLISMADENKKGLDEILANKDLADKLKKLLLESQYIPDELKSQLTDADSQIVRQLFEAIMKGEEPEIFDLNPLNLGAVYSYLMQIANANGITVEQLLTDPKYESLLKATLQDFNDVIEELKGWEDLSAEQYQKNLLNIYDGNAINETKPKAIPILRTFIDHVSETTEIVAEELLTKTEYAEIMKKATQAFGKTSIFMNASSHNSSKGMREIVGNLFNGNNAKALGMDENEVKGFASEMEALAKKNGVTSEELLSNSTYADKVKEALNSSKNAQDVGTIYSKADATVSQKVAKNLVEGSHKISTVKGTDENGNTVVSK